MFSMRKKRNIEYAPHKANETVLTARNLDLHQMRAFVKKIAKKSMLKSFLTSTGFDLSSWAFTAMTSGTALIPSQIVNETLSMVTDSNYIRKANEQLIRDLARLYEIDEKDLKLKLANDMEKNIISVKIKTDEAKKKVYTSRKIILGSVRLRTKFGLLGNFLPAIGSLVTSIIVYKSIENFGYSIIATIKKSTRHIESDEVTELIRRR